MTAQEAAGVVLGLAVLLVIAIVLFALTSCGGMRLEPVDRRALLNEQRASRAILSRTDSGAVQSLAEVIFCSAGATLHRAGAPAEDAGTIPCPVQ